MGRCEGTKTPSFDTEHPPIRLRVSAPADGVRVGNFYFNSANETIDVTPDENAFIRKYAGSRLAIIDPGMTEGVDERIIRLEMELIEWRGRAEKAEASVADLTERLGSSQRQFVALEKRHDMLIVETARGATPVKPESVDVSLIPQGGKQGNPNRPQQQGAPR